MGLAFTEFVHSGQEMHSQNRRRSICFQVLFHALLLMGRGVLTPLNYLLAPGWGVRPGVPNPFGMIFGSEPPFEKVLLPQDQMILEERDPKCLSKGQNAFYPSKTYTYEKTFFVPAAWKDQESILEFEGVMTQAMVYLNDELITTNR